MSIPHAALMPDLGYAGIGPGAVSLNWTESVDPNFSKYVLQESTISSIGPWATVANDLSPRTITSFYASGFSLGIIPGATEWWQVLYFNSSRQTAITNSLQTTQPPTATLSLSHQTATSVEFAWNNRATYGGLLAFDSYRIMEATFAGTFSPVASVSGLGSVDYNLTGLSPSTSYRFYLNTTDKCNGCTTLSATSSASNTVVFNAPGTLTVMETGAPEGIDSGQSVSFSCKGFGGVLPYTYNWSFGDGSLGTGANATHLYSGSGSMMAVCSITDALGTISETVVRVYVASGPAIRSVLVNQTSPYTGSRVTLEVVITGGIGGYSVSWSNLPPGCRTENSSAINCSPSAPGDYLVTVTVTDHAQESVSSTVPLTVRPLTVLGLPLAIGYWIIIGSTVLVVVVAAIIVVLVFRARKSSDPIGPRL